jgi:hypothetical protein
MGMYFFSFGVYSKSDLNLVAKYSSLAFLATVMTISGTIHPTAAFGGNDLFSRCLADIRSGKYGPNGGVDFHGNPVDISQAVGMTYGLCKSACSAGPETFDWSQFSQQFSAWLLPWLALISQLPFGAKYRVDNLTSVLLTVGSPTLAAYSLILTVLNRQWVARRFSDISYTNTHHAFRILSSLQQAPLKITNEDALLSSLVVLPRNDAWWRDLVERLEFTHTWSISAATSIAWVFTAYLLTVLGTFLQLRDNPIQMAAEGQSVGGLWLWLLPIVIAWLQVSPKCDSRRLESAIRRVNDIAVVATQDPSSPELASDISEARAFTFFHSEDVLYDDQQCNAPIFNYARFLPWTQAVDEVVSVFRAAACHAERHIRVDQSGKSVRGQPRWVPLEDLGPPRQIHDENRIGSVEQVEEYCAPPDYVRFGHWGPDVFSRFFLATFAAVSLQWGTTGAAVIIIWYTPTVGLGCRSTAYLIYAAVSTLVWMMLVASSVLTHSLSTRRPRIHYHSASADFRGAVRLLSITLRRLGKLLAACNATWIITVCFMQFGNLFDTCYCNSCVTSLGNRAYNVVLITASNVKVPWIGGVTLGCGCVVLFVCFVNILHNQL